MTVRWLGSSYSDRPKKELDGGEKLKESGRWRLGCILREDWIAIRTGWGKSRRVEKEVKPEYFFPSEYSALTRTSF